MSIRVSFFTLCLFAACGGSVLAADSKPAVFGLTFSADGKWLAAGTGTSSVPGPGVIWKVDDWSVHSAHHSDSAVRHVDFSPNNELLAFGKRSGQVVLVDVTTGRAVRQLDAHTADVYCVDFGPRGELLASSSKDSSIKLWNVAEGSLVHDFDGHQKSVDGVAISPDGKWLLSASEDHEARLWNIETREVAHTYSPNTLIARRCGFSSDGQFFYVSRWDGTTRIRDVKSGRLRAAVTGTDAACMTADNQLIVTTGYSAVNVFALELRSPTQEEAKNIGKLIMQFASDDYDARVAASEKIIEIGLPAEAQLHAATKSADAETRVRSRHLRKAIMKPEPIATLKGHAGKPEVCCISPDGKLIASGCRGGDVKIWTTDGFKELATLEIPTMP